MSSKKKLQIFISSTYLDLRDERQAAVEAVLANGHIPAGMELFAAGDESQMNVIKRWIDESDVYMLILGGRYGSVEPKSQKSYIQLEYEYALEKGKPMFSVVIDEKHLERKVKKHGSSMIEKDHPDKLKTFRDMVCSKVVRFWNDPKDIKLFVMETMADFNKRTELIGWVPGNEAIDANVVNEMTRLSQENAEVEKTKLEAARLRLENQKLLLDLQSMKIELASKLLKLAPTISEEEKLSYVSKLLSQLDNTNDLGINESEGVG